MAGIQASLDLSAAGFRVYLVEESPTIGGNMARLDKTFPTGDCATCIISPKLVECMRDYNIDVLTMADVTALEGEAGPFHGRGAKTAPQREGRKMHRLRRLLDGLPGAQHGRDSAAVPAQRAARRSRRRQASPKSSRNHEGGLGNLMPVLQEIDRTLRLSSPARFSNTWPARGDCGWRRFCGWPVSTTAFGWSRRAATWSRSARERRATPAARGTLLERLEKELGVDPGQTDKSGRFTLQTVRCLGLCALSPAMKIDGRSFGRVDIDRVPGDVGAIRMSFPIRNSADLDQARAAGQATLRPQRLKILVGSASCGVAVGAREVEAAARRAVEELGLDAVVCRTGCIGFCAQRAAAGSRASQRAAGELRQHDAREDPPIAGRLRRQRRSAARTGPWATSMAKNWSRPAKSARIREPIGRARRRAAMVVAWISTAARRRSSCGTAARSIRCRWTRRSPAARIAGPSRR